MLSNVIVNQNLTQKDFVTEETVYAIGHLKYILNKQ